MKTIKKLTAILMTMVMMVLTLSGCGKAVEVENGEQSSVEKKIQIGMSFDSFVIERWQRDRDVFVSMAKELGAEVNVQNANGDSKQQKQQIEYFIKEGMDVIVIICIDSEAIADSVKRALDAGIKVISYDRLITGVDVDLYISFDNEQVGELMGNAMVNAGLSAGKVIMLCGSTSDNNVAQVGSGFEKVMEENGNEIIDTFYAEGWRAELAGEYIYDNMDKVQEADAIMCGNDDLASRVVYALSEKRLAGKKLVVGQDADLEACQRIVEGTQLMTVYKPIEKLAQKAAECAVKLGRGEILEEEELSVFEDADRSIPYLKIQPISVTAENMNEVIINTGFHLKEDVYLNVPGKMPQ